MHYNDDDPYDRNLSPKVTITNTYIDIYIASTIKVYIYTYIHTYSQIKPSNSNRISTTFNRLYTQYIIHTYILKHTYIHTYIQPLKLVDIQVKHASHAYDNQNHGPRVNVTSGGAYIKY